MPSHNQPLNPQAPVWVERKREGVLANPTPNRGNQPLNPQAPVWVGKEREGVLANPPPNGGNQPLNPRAPVWVEREREGALANSTPAPVNLPVGSDIQTPPQLFMRLSPNLSDKTHSRWVGRVHGTTSAVRSSSAPVNPSDIQPPPQRPASSSPHLNNKTRNSSSASSNPRKSPSDESRSQESRQKFNESSSDAHVSSNATSPASSKTFQASSRPIDSSLLLDDSSNPNLSAGNHTFESSQAQLPSSLISIRSNTWPYRPYIQVRPNQSILDLKERFVNEKIIPTCARIQIVDVREFHLRHNGRELLNWYTLSQNGVQEGDVLDFSLRQQKWDLHQPVIGMENANSTGNGEVFEFAVLLKDWNWILGVKVIAGAPGSEKCQVFLCKDGTSWRRGQDSDMSVGETAFKSV